LSVLGRRRSAGQLNPGVSFRTSRTASTAAQIKDALEEDVSGVENDHVGSIAEPRLGVAEIAKIRPNGSTSKPRKSGGKAPSGMPSSKSFNAADIEEPDDIAELSRFDTSSDLDLFDLGSTEAQMMEAGTSPVKDALMHRADDHFFEPHDIEYLAELEHRMDEMNEGDHPNVKTRQVEPRFNAASMSQNLYQKFRSESFSKKGSLEMHYTYGLGRNGKSIPSRFDWRQRATSRTRKQFGKDIVQRVTPTLAKSSKDNRWRDAIEVYSEK
jgi:hypothetical protein